jgi:hypothetical protein
MFPWTLGQYSSESKKLSRARVCRIGDAFGSRACLGVASFSRAAGVVQLI